MVSIAGMPVLNRAIALIDGDKYERLTETLDPSDPFFIETQAKFRELKKETQCQYLYTMARYENGVHRFIFDGEEPESEKFSPLGKEEDISDYEPEYMEAYEARSVQFPPTMTNLEEWGRLVSAYMPIFNSSGNVVGVIGVDFQGEEVYQSIMSRLWQQIIFAVIFTAIGLLVFYLFQRDIELRNKAASHAKSQFLARMSHEIRTPMNAVIGMADLALRENITPVAREQVSTIRQAGEHLLSIVNDILDFSKIESGRLEIIPADYQLSSLVNDVVNIIKMRLLDTNVQFMVDIDSKLPNALFGDETRIRQVLLNILSNAVKFTKKGSITFAVNGRIEGKDTVILIINIFDTGKGIKKEDIGKLFDDFVQVDALANKGIEGTGLGLAIAKSLVKAMGGDINVASEYGKGSIFTITLPQKIRSSEPIANINLSEINADKKLVINFNAQAARVLVVDDVNTNLKVAEGLLSPYKMQVDLCTNGTEAIEAIKAKSYDLVFMDHMMPEMDGVDTAKRIREFNTNLPIVALTANAISGTKEMFLSSGFNGFLSKPIDTIKLDAILQKWIPKEKQEKLNEEIKSSNQKDIQIFNALHKDGMQKIEELKKCLEMGDYSLYTTHIHGLKGAAANAGEKELSEFAEELEKAGKRGDFAFIKAKSNDFFAALQTRLNRINEILLSNKKDSVDYETLKTELLKLKEGINAFDLAAIGEAANTLQAFPQAESILQNILRGEYDNAISAIDALLL
jgi:signal transduction histidine kinase/DNA-binding response OmpR family regulator